MLHALTLTGGLPGVDARNEVVVLRGAHNPESAAAETTSPNDLTSLMAQANGVDKCRIVRIPLRHIPGEPLSFGPDDVILKQGDVVYIEARDTDHFLTGGLLPGGQFPLPRDYELDVLLGAIKVIAGGSADGPAGANAASYLYRGGSGPGNICAPTRVIILRTVPGCGQISIHVSLKRALLDPQERIGIQAGDVVLLQYTPGELLTNYFLNLFNFNLNFIRLRQVQ